MSYVLGCDFSTVHIDYVMLDETTNEAVWWRFTPAGETALERLLNLRESLPLNLFYSSVYLAAVELPYGRNQPGTSAKLNQVFGAVVALLPWDLQVWAVAPHEWKKGLGLKAKPDAYDIGRIAKDSKLDAQWDAPLDEHHTDWQNAWDAYCIALWARETNRRAIEAA